MRTPAEPPTFGLIYSAITAQHHAAEDGVSVDALFRSLLADMYGDPDCPDAQAELANWMALHHAGIAAMQGAEVLLSAPFVEGSQEQETQAEWLWEQIDWDCDKLCMIPAGIPGQRLERWFALRPPPSTPRQDHRPPQWIAHPPRAALSLPHPTQLPEMSMGCSSDRARL